MWWFLDNLSVWYVKEKKNDKRLSYVFEHLILAFTRSGQNWSTHLCGGSGQSQCVV